MSAQSNPTVTARSAFDALEGRDWKALAYLADTKAIESLRQDALGMLILTTEQRIAGEKVGGGYNPQDVVIADHLSRVGAERAKGFRDHPTIAKLASLSPSEFFVQWAEAAYGQRNPNDPVRDVVGLYRRIIGTVDESADTSYVLYRRESRHVEMGELKVDLPGRVMILPVARSRDGWRMQFNDDIGWSIDFSHVVFYERPDRSSKIDLPPRRIPPEPPAPRADRLNARPTPLEVVESAFAAFERRDWKALSTLVHPTVLRSFQHQQVSYLASWSLSREARATAKRQGQAFAMMYSYDDSLSPETLSQVKDIEIPLFSRHPRLGDLSMLSPEEFFQEWCQAAYEAGGERLGAWKSSLERKTIGQVFEGDSLAHVLYRTPRLYAPDRMPLQWSDAGWRVMLNDDIGWTADLDLDREDP